MTTVEDFFSLIILSEFKISHWHMIHDFILFSKKISQAEEAKEAKRLRKRKKAEALRLLDMEKRQKQRLEEVRETQRKVSVLTYTTPS